MFRKLSMIPPSLLLVLSIVLPFVSQSNFSQEQVLTGCWLEVRSENFHIYSQQSTRQINRFANELEIWRQVASLAISDVGGFPRANISSLAYLFDDVETLQTFVTANESIFSPTLRANFLAGEFEVARDWLGGCEGLIRLCG